MRTDTERAPHEQLEVRGYVLGLRSTRMGMVTYALTWRLPYREYLRHILETATLSEGVPIRKRPKDGSAAYRRVSVSTHSVDNLRAAS